ncbi:LytTR family transcriptional regulator DNA-binding domain-containing protein [Polaribacter marinivivus]|uniref:LytTR family transcriptional regulator DNA-binding domain-containing protein n=1 Tax=Polaribacter marinivivus TaxID=1524260 RepID=UPI003D339D83
MNKPYYFNPSIKFKSKVSLVFGFFFSFLYIFEPFTLSTFKEYLFDYTLGIGLVTFVGTLIVLIIPPILFKNYFNENKWTIGRNLIYIGLCIIFIGTILWFFGQFFKQETTIKHINYFTFIYYTFLVSALPLIIFISFNEKNIRQKREETAKEINDFKNAKLEVNLPLKIVIISSENNKESFSIEVEKLVYITSEGNYASFFIIENNELKEKILRVTLTKIESFLKDYDFIIRCYKSYIVNTKYVNKVAGNARGYLLKCNILDFYIPVSRKFSKKSLLTLVK